MKNKNTTTSSARQDVINAIRETYISVTLVPGNDGVIARFGDLELSNAEWIAEGVRLCTSQRTST